MDDAKIVQLYWDRNQLAIPVTADKYGSYCASIARNILGSREDAEECVNDTWLQAWNSMPPHRPALLSAFLGKIVRNLSFNRHKHNTAAKRGGGEVSAVLDELSQLVSGKDDVHQQLEHKEITRAVNAFLLTLPQDKRGIFIRRYWHTDSISAIASRYNMKENAVSVTLNRLRKKLGDYLKERGLYL
ncbi:MAG: sigma-70 family RNA polymerase sigma factor [Clostridia bacterium]|nr:sigma-70 family RNA polymerase sigma factor [Clostridia bacterium]